MAQVFQAVAVYCQDHLEQERVGVGATATDLTRHLANGGTAQANKSYMVGERGPEIFTPGATGTVTPNHALGGSTSIS